MITTKKIETGSLVYDNHVVISVGKSRHAATWYPQRMLWSEFIDRLKTPVRTPEKYKEYLSYRKGQQDDLKDVGGYVAGELKDNKRKASSVINRQIVALDADSIPPGGTEEILKRLGGLSCSWALYSTRKHASSAPRLRILFPLTRPATADEYEPIARKIASSIGMEFFDPTTFQANRLMYWPSASSDGEFIFQYNDSQWLDTDGILGMYEDWKDITSWPEVPGQVKQQQRAVKAQGDPTEKKGAVGAFCKAYGIAEAIEKFLPVEYDPVPGMADRYTYIDGSTSGGAIVYDNKFLYSHHATDPTSNRLVNAFDLVRLHRFGDLDDKAYPETPTPSLPSYKAMTEMVYSDPELSGALNQERRDQAVLEFSAQANVDLSDLDQATEWIKKLKVSQTTGLPQKTIDNLLLILENDPLIKGTFGHDEMAGKPRILQPLPWKKNISRRTFWDDSDSAGLRHYLEKSYSLDAKTKLDDAFTIAAIRHGFHEVRDYLKGLIWDGVPRLDTMLVDYLGAEDTPYVRAVTRKTFTAAVARVMRPGIKFDTSLTLIGPQGAGKTTLLQKMGRGYHVEIGLSFKGKETSEIIQGYWIVELGELKGMTKAEDNDVKQFMSRTEDVYREAYGRYTKAFPRQCVFVGTSNNPNFLKDSTGSRRFWPVDLMIHEPKKDVFKDLDVELDQLWAEAVMFYASGERLNLSREMEQEALMQQEEHREINPKEGQIREWLDHLLPEGYQQMRLDARRSFWWDHEEGTEVRDRVCALEVWCELYGGDPKSFDRRQAAEINGVLEVLPGWERSRTNMRFGPGYGVQRGYRRRTILSTDLSTK